MADIKLEEFRAKQWIEDVKNEIDIVEGILNNVTRAMTEVPGEDDSLYQGIRKIANTVTSVWSKLINTLKRTSETIDTTIKNTVSAGQEIITRGEELEKKMNG